MTESPLADPGRHSHNRSRNDYDIVICGAGIAGSALALALAGKGLSIAVIEARPLHTPDLPGGYAVADFDARVSALTPRSVALLDALGAWSAIVGYRQCAYRHMTVWDAQGTGQIEFDREEVGVPALGHIVENRAIVAALLQRVGQCGDIAIRDGGALAGCQRRDNTMHLELDNGEQLSAQLLVGADGALSRVRELMGFEMREWDYGHRAIVATVRTRDGHEDTAWQRFLPTGPLALLPLPGEGGHLCSIVWSISEPTADELLALDDAAFAARLTRASEARLGDVLECSPRAAFPLRQRHAVDYVQAGVALVGDAAHTIHPLAGQGINLGLADVAALAGEINAALPRGVGPGQLPLLRRYQRQRKGDNLLMMGAMDGFKRLFEQQALPLRWLRNAGMRQVDRLAPLKQQLMRHAMGLS